MASLAPAGGKPTIVCSCGTNVGVVRVDVGTDKEREMLVELSPIAVPEGVLVWVEIFSGHPPAGDVMPMGGLYVTHVCE